MLLVLGGCHLILGLDEYTLATCDDGSRGGAETDVDCGGPTCGPCADGRACVRGADCSSGVCAAGLCVTPTCDDGARNGTETDVDCGGASCPACGNDKACADASDCANLVCSAGVCAAPACDDGAQNGTETDRDCGGGACNPCDLGRACVAHDDCVVETVCRAGFCAADYLWSKAFGGATKDEATAVATDTKSGAVLVAGIFNGAIDFGGSMPLTSAGSADIFLAKLDAKDGDHIWSKGFGDGDSQFDARVAVDSSGDVFLACTGFGVMNFGIGELPSAGASDIFLAKLNGIGGPLWHARFGDADGQFLSGMAMDPAGNIFLVGTFGGTIDFGGGPLTAAGSGDMFIAAIKGYDGSHMWSKSFDPSGAIMQPTVAIDALGNVLVGGRYEGSVSFGGELHTSLPEPDAFIAKLNGAGDYVWSKSWGSNGVQGVSSIAATPKGDVFVAGSFENFMVLPNGAVVMGHSGRDPFVARLNGETGDHYWVKPFGDNGLNQESQVIASDPDGNAIVAGRFDGELNFSPMYFKASGMLDLFVLKLDSSGQLLWFKQGAGPTAGSARGLALAPNGDAALAGTFVGTLKFGGEGLQSSTGPGDAFVTMLGPP